jgi:glucosamine--fructose-6-phosphate aminotransferase (isomerizing)
MISDDGSVFLERVKGRVEVLGEKISKNRYPDISCGIAHTRWATHGVPSEDNAHPHTDCDKAIVVVHNGIIENYLELKEELKSHNFRSDTDTEVVAHLIEENIKELSKGLKSKQTSMLQPLFFQAFLKTLKKLKGSFAIAVVWDKSPGVILSARRFSPLVIGKGESENFLSSDVSGFLEYTNKVYFVDDDEVVFMDKNNVAFFDFEGKKKKWLKRADTGILCSRKYLSRIAVLKIQSQEEFFRLAIIL